MEKFTLMKNDWKENCCESGHNWSNGTPVMEIHTTDSYHIIKLAIRQLSRCFVIQY